MCVSLPNCKLLEGRAWPRPILSAQGLPQNLVHSRYLLDAKHSPNDLWVYCLCLHIPNMGKTSVEVHVWKLWVPPSFASWLVSWDRPVPFEVRQLCLLQDISEWPHLSTHPGLSTGPTLKTRKTVEPCLAPRERMTLLQAIERKELGRSDHAQSSHTFSSFCSSKSTQGKGPDSPDFPTPIP